MNRPPILAAAGIAASLLLAGCFLEECPHTLDFVEASGTAPVYFGVENATLARQALEDMGFEATRDGLVVRATHDDLRVLLDFAGGNMTSLRVWDEGVDGEYGSGDGAQRQAAVEVPAAWARINATVAAFEARVPWPGFTMGPAAPVISVC